MIILTLNDNRMFQLRFKDKDIFFYWFVCDMRGEYEYCAKDRHVKINTDDGQLVITSSMIKNCEIIDE